MAGDKKHQKIQQLVDNVHYGLHAMVVVPLKFEKGRGFIYDCKTWAVSETYIDIFFKPGLTTEKKVRVPLSVDFSSEGENKKTVTL